MELEYIIIKQGAWTKKLYTLYLALVMLWILALAVKEGGSLNPLEKGKSVTKISFFR